MSQIQVTKQTMAVHTGSPAADITVAKLVMYARLIPGDDGSTPSTGQGHVHQQIIRRG